MIVAPIYPTCLASTAVVALLDDGAGSIRLYPFEDVPLGPDDPPPTLPYATWQNVGGLPYNTLACAPDADQFSLQVNVWGVTTAQVRAVTQAIRDAIEPVAYIVRWGSQVRDAQTKAFGYDFDVDWNTYR